MSKKKKETKHVVSIPEYLGDIISAYQYRNYLENKFGIRVKMFSRPDGTKINPPEYLRNGDVVNFL